VILISKTFNSESIIVNNIKSQVIKASWGKTDTFRVHVVRSIQTRPCSKSFTFPKIILPIFYLLLFFKRILVALLVGSHYRATAIPSKAAEFVSSPPLAVATPCSMTSSLWEKMMDSSNSRCSRMFFRQFFKTSIENPQISTEIPK